MNENKLKAIALAHLRTTVGFRNGAVIASEYALGDAGRRVDLSILANEWMGLEIKSELDTLRRLPEQLEAYAASFDRVILAVAERHLKNTLALAPEVFAVWSVDSSGALCVIREGCRLEHRAACNHAKLMTADELRKFLGVRQTSRSRAALIEMAGLRPVLEVKSAVQEAFRRRFSPTSDAFIKATARKKITEDHVALLSRFADRRELLIEADRAKEAFWSEWQAKVQNVLGSQEPSYASSLSA